MSRPGANRYYQGPVSEHFDGVRFYNPGYPNTDKSLLDLLRWLATAKRKAWQHHPLSQIVPLPASDKLRITLIGHASLFVQLAGLNILIDPVWSERASPLSWIGPRRVNAPAIALEALPHIDAILLTHNHYDHMDIPTLKRLQRYHRPRVIAPLGNDSVLVKACPAMTAETPDWHESVALSRGVRVWLVPANHWSSRRLRDRRMALWGGFYIKSDTGSLYVAGDTGYGDGHIFRDIQTRYGAPDVAALPIGAYAPRWFMKDQHINPAEAIRVMADCGAARALGVHWGTFPLTDEPQYEPEEELKAQLLMQGIDSARFIAMRPGDIWQG